MYTVIKTAVFESWLSALRDRRARARILARITRMTAGNLGDVKSLGEGLHEARIFYGPGYRLYFLREGRALIVLLSGGDKSTQRRDIEYATAMADEWRNNNE